MSGPSKYDKLARDIVEMLQADAAVLVVIGGTQGSGACPALRMDGKTPPEKLQALLVHCLRELADAMELGEQPGRADWHTEES